MLVALLLVGFVTDSRAAILIGNEFESGPTVAVEHAVNHSSPEQLAKLTTAALTLATADDTNEFTSRPNLPYISAHYTKEQLAAAQIDTVLIINARGEPLFWRRLIQGRNRGFADARAFLAALPKLPASAAPRVPGIAGLAMLNSGPTLVVAMPIFGATGKGRARGWLILARAPTPIPVHPFGGLIQSQVRASSPLDPAVSGSILAARQLVGVAAPAAFFTVPPAAWIALLLVIGAVLAAKSGMWRKIGDHAERVRVSVRPIDTTIVSTCPVATSHEQRLTLSPNKLTPERRIMGISAGPKMVALQTRILAANAVFRYQPQVDLQTGQAAGVEALLCVPAAAEYRPATELATDIEKAGFEFELFECRLQEACRAQRTWLGNVGHDFAVGVPVSRRMLANAALLPLVQRVLAEHEISPALLELEVEEAALGACSLALRTLTKIHEAGISIALDGFNANHSNLRLLAILPIAKLRIDPWLLLRMADRVAEAQLFAGILGAARGLGIAVCATGVASADMLAAVLRYGRPLAQGTAVAASLSAPEFLEALRESNVDTVTLRPLDLDPALLVNGSSAPQSFEAPIPMPGPGFRAYSATASG